jgi:peptide/nickel transport system ATP-binding protein
VTDVPTLEVENLRVDLQGSDTDIVDEVSFAVGEGEVLGLVGESGSGKTTVSLALLGYNRRGARIRGGSIRIDGEDLLAMAPAAQRRLRGGRVSYVPQDPRSALNPALRIGRQLREVLRAHGAGSSTRIAEMMSEVALPDDPGFLKRYPHELSGGQQQRVAIAMAFACRPRVIVLDEPTTGLDVTTQAHVLATVRDLCLSHRVAAVYVSHDLAVVANLARRAAVMYAGRVVEVGTVDQIFGAPAHPYTRRLVAAIPDLRGERPTRGIGGHAPGPRSRPSGCFFRSRCELAVEECETVFPPTAVVEAEHTVRCYEARAWGEEPVAGMEQVAGRGAATGDHVLTVSDLHASYGDVEVLHGVGLEVHAGRCMALVGESGSGKTTLARCIAGLHSGHDGTLLLNGVPLERNGRSRAKADRQAIQYIFQNPYSSLNPRKTVGQSVAQPLDLFFGLGRKETARRVAEALERVSLSPAMARQYPDQLSGGERQRVAIAEALACEPTVLICDEITSSLDVSVQAAILELLARLQSESDLTMLFVTHNLAIVRTIAQTVAVMNDGRIVEHGDVDAVLDRPQAEYTRRLMHDTPDFAERAPSA